MSCSPIPDLAVLLFSTDLQHTMPDGPGQLEDRAADAEVTTGAGAGPGANTSECPMEAAAAEEADGVEAEQEDEEEEMQQEQEEEEQQQQVEADEDEAEATSEAVLLGGFSRYLIPQQDLAALLQLRNHLQLLLHIKVSEGEREEV